MSVEDRSCNVFAKAREAAFKSNQVPGRYITYRGLTNLADTEDGRLNPWGYNDILPALDGLKLEEWIELKTKQKGKVRLLDVGCGQGNYLTECKERWGAKVDCFGITSRVFYSDDQIRQRLSPEDIILNHKSKGVDIRIADAQNINSAFPAERFDVITAVHLAKYLADSWSLIRGMYSALEDEGIGLINEFPMRLTDSSDVSTLVDYLRSTFGIDISRAHKVGEYYHFAFQKTKPELVLPLNPECVEPTRDEDVILFNFTLGASVDK